MKYRLSTDSINVILVSLLITLNMFRGNRKSHLHEMCLYSIFFLNKYFVKFGLLQRCPSLAVVKQNKNNEKGEKYLMQLFKVSATTQYSILDALAIMKWKQVIFCEKFTSTERVKTKQLLYDSQPKFGLLQRCRSLAVVKQNKIQWKRWEVPCVTF